MVILTKAEFLLNKKRYMREIAEGAVFIYPTDTIYGIGCSAINSKAVKRVRGIKGREKNPFSVIAPSKEWIINNCETDEKIKGWLNKLPGAYTLILNLKKLEAVAPEVNNNLGTLGVRLPAHWISGVVEEFGFPIITTSANLSGESFMTTLDNLDDRIKTKVDFIIYDGEKEGHPSTLVNLTKQEPELIKR